MTNKKADAGASSTIRRYFRFLRWGFVYRSQRGFKPLLFILFVVDRRGITFPIRSEETTWNWPWVRPQPEDVWFDPCIGPFPSLKARREFWQRYAEAQQEDKGGA